MNRKLKNIKITLSILTLCTVFSGFLFPDPVAAANAWSIRQEINITDGYFAAQANEVATSSAIIQYDPSKYSGTVTVYFEAVASTSASFTNTITLRENGTGTDDCTISIPGGTTSYTLLRSSACTMPSTATEYVARISSSASGTTGVKSVRLVVLQSFADTASNAATSTETQIEIGNEETYSNTSTSTFASPKYWTYDSTKWDGGTQFYAEVTFAGTGTFSSSTSYTTAGTYTVNIPSNTVSTWVQLWGGGGAGGPAASNPSGGDGGAGGQYASSTLLNLAGSSNTLVVAASTAGCSGGTCISGNSSSWQSNVVVAQGGAGGGQGVASTTGDTVGCVGDTCLAGGNGGKGTSTYGAGGGEGASPSGAGNSATGAGVAGTGGAGGDGGAKNTSSKTSGNAGSAPGGGGGGAYRAGNGGSVSGGVGAAGQALIINNITGSTTIAVQEDNGSFGTWTDVAYIYAGTAPTSATRYRSSAFTPTNGKHYRLAFKSLDSRGTYTIYNAKVIIDQVQVQGVFDSVPTINYGGVVNQLGASKTYLAAGQAFTVNSNITLTSAQFYIQKQGSPTGNLTAKLYAASGVVGSNAVPSGAALATSDITNADSLGTGSTGFITFNFSGNQQYSLVPGNYVIVVEYSGGDATNYLGSAYSSVSSDHSGNAVTYSTAGGVWSSDNTIDTIFKISGTGSNFTQLEPQYLLANTKLSSGTSLQNFLTKWDSSEWTGTTATYLHAVDSANGSASVATLNTAGGTLLTGSTVTSPSNQSTSTSVTMPANGNLDMKATTNNNDVYASRILVQASQTISTPTVTISGTVYTDEGSTLMTNGPTVRVKVNGAGSYSAAANGSGAYSISGITVSAGDILTVYLDTNGGNKAALVTRASGSSQTLNLYQNYVILRSDDGGALTNTNIDNYDSGQDADLNFTVTSGNLTVLNANTLYMQSGTYTPGGNVTSDNYKQVGGTFNGGSGSITFGDGSSPSSGFVLAGGTFNSTTGTLTISAGKWTHTAGGTFNNNSGTVSENNCSQTWDVSSSETFNNLTVNGSGGGCTGTNLTIATGDTLVVTGTFTANGGYDTGTVEARGGVTVGSNTALGTGTLSFLVSGNQTISSSGGALPNLNINKSSGTVSVTGDLYITSFTLGATSAFTSTSGTLIVNTGGWTDTAGGTFSNNSGTVEFRTCNQTFDVNSSETFNNVTLTHSGGACTGASLNIASGDTLITTGTLSDNSSVNGGTLEARGDVTVGSSATTDNAKLAFTGSAAQTYTNNGGVAPTGMVTINKTNATDTVTLAGTATSTFAGGLVITKGTLSQGATFNMSTASTTFVDTNGTWTNTGTGDVALGGNVTNKGTITLNSNNGSQCIDGSDDIVIMSTSNGVQRTWSGAGTFNLYNIFAKDMLGALTAYNSTFSNSNWSNAGACTVTISGTVYTDEGVTAMGSGRTVRVKVNGAGLYSASTAADGTYSVTGVPWGATDVLTIYLDGATEKAVTVTRDVDAYQATITGVDLYQNYVIVRDESATAINNANLGVFDSSGDPDINFTVSSGNLTVLNSNTLYMKSGTFTPGGDITAPTFKQVGGTLNGGSGTVSILNGFTLSGGTFNSTTATTTVAGNWTHTAGGTFNHNNGTVDIGVGNGADWDVSTSETFNNLIIRHGNGNLRVASGDTLIVLGTLTLNGNGGGRSLETGTIEARGNVIIGSGNNGGGGGTISFLNTAAQSITSAGGGMPDINVNKPSGTVSVTGDLSTGAFTLSSGTFTSTSGIFTVTTTWTHTAGGTFNHNNGTVVLSTGNVGGVDVNSSETFNNLTFSVGNGGSVIGSGDTLIVLGTLTFNSGTQVLSGGTLEAQGNVVFNSGSSVSSLLNFTGSAAQTLTTNTVNTPTGMISINKTNATDTVTLAGTATSTFTGGLIITKGTLSQGATFNMSTASTTFVDTNGTWSNTGTGDVQLGGNVVNKGTITLNSNNGTQCVDGANDILITSSVGGTQRTWSGAGTFNLYNVAVTDMLGALTTYNSTFSNSNWTNGGACSVSRGGGFGGIDGGDGGGNQTTGGTSGGAATNGGGDGGSGGGIAEVGGGTQRATASSGMAASLSKAYPGNVQAGDLLVITGAGWTGGTPMSSATITTSGTGVAGTTWTVLIGSGGGTNTRTFIAYGFATANGPATVTVTPDVSVYMSFSIDEFSGVSAIDAQGSGTTGSGTSPTDPVTTVTSNDLVIGVAGPDGGGQTITVNSPWTQIGKITDNAASQAHVGVFQIVTTPATYSPSITLGVSSTWKAHTISFKPSAGGTTGGTAGGGAGGAAP